MPRVSPLFPFVPALSTPGVVSVRGCSLSGSPPARISPTGFSQPSSPPAALRSSSRANHLSGQGSFDESIPSGHGSPQATGLQGERPFFDLFVCRFWALGNWFSLVTVAPVGVVHELIISGVGCLESLSSWAQPTWALFTGRLLLVTWPPRALYACGLLGCREAFLIVVDH
jgi:hypothetical protein